MLAGLFHCLCNFGKRDNSQGKLTAEVIPRTLLIGIELTSIQSPAAIVVVKLIESLVRSVDRNQTY